MINHCIHGGYMPIMKILFNFCLVYRHNFILKIHILSLASLEPTFLAHKQHDQPLHPGNLSFKTEKQIILLFLRTIATNTTNPRFLTPVLKNLLLALIRGCKTQFILNEFHNSCFESNGPYLPNWPCQQQAQTRY